MPTDIDKLIGTENLWPRAITSVTSLSADTFYGKNQLPLSNYIFYDKSLN